MRAKEGIPQEEVVFVYKRLAQKLAAALLDLDIIVSRRVKQ